MFIAISAVLLAVAQPALAQDAPKFELGVGYQYMHDNNSSLDFSNGWFVSAGADVVSWFALVGEVGASYKTVVSGTKADLSVNEYTFLGGPKITASSRSPVAPFVQILFGAARGTLSLNGSGSSLSASKNHFAVQPGAGVDINPSPRFGIRVEADGRAVHTDTDTAGQWRILAGIVFRN
jgi:hypothetical protein